MKPSHPYFGPQKGPLNLAGPAPRQHKISKCRKITTIVLSLLLIIFGATCAFVAFKFLFKTTPGQIVLEETLNEMATDIDQNFDPCDDFYAYACGSFAKKHPITRNESVINYFTLEEQKVQQGIIQELNNDKLLADSSPLPLRYVKQAWDACIAGNDNGDHQMSLFHQYFRGINFAFKFDEKLADSLKKGHKILFDLKLSPHPTNEYSHVLLFNPPALKFALGKGESYSTFRYLVRLISQAADKDTNESEAIARDIIDFETQLEALKTSPWDRVDDGTKLVEINLSDLKNNNMFYWDYFLDRLDNSTRWRTVYTSDKKFLENITAAIDNRTEEFLVTYMKVVMLDESCFFVSDTCRRMQWDTIEWRRSNTSRDDFVEQKCFQWLQETAEDILLKIYQSSPRMDPYNFEVRVAINETANELARYVNQSSWMDEETKRIALDQVLKINFEAQIMYPWWLWSFDSITAKYNTSFHSNASYVDSLTHFLESISFKKKQDIKSSVSYSWTAPWPIKYLSSQPTFLQARRVLFVPGAAAFGHFFTGDFPVNMQYGMLGSLVAQQIIHSIDLTAHRHRDRTHTAFWSDKTIENFTKISECLIDLYDNQTNRPDEASEPVDMIIDGTYTFDENFADVLAARIAYGVYSRLDRTQKSVRFPFPLDTKNQDQIFFISLANSRCANEKNRSPKDIWFSRFSPSRHRVNVPLSQMPQFARAFNCDYGRRMNPEKKCYIN